VRAGWVAAGWVSNARQAVCRCILTLLERIETSEVFSTAIGQATKQVAAEQQFGHPPDLQERRVVSVVY
jgi:hypothetical protein